MHGNLAHHLFLGLGNDFFHDLIGLRSIVKGGILHCYGSRQRVLRHLLIRNEFFRFFLCRDLLAKALILISFLKNRKDVLLRLLRILGISLLTLLLGLLENHLRLFQKLLRHLLSLRKCHDILCRNKEVSLFARYDQKHREYHGDNRHKPCQNRKSHVGCLRDGSQRHDRNGAMIALRGILALILDLLLFPTRAGDLIGKNQYAGNFHAQQTGKHGNGNEESDSGQFHRSNAGV